ncbi:Golgi reassembly-stacking protein 2 [Striga asiatica]|uniref:Golgi reassembly-stacking protein 2 n=1 Tax=Striga asiatica TaxID=4170 RepID=A0A5A7RBA6_STRAF|nr:Golgi reassembly-stacking protein 2 [Striga asiatica]
MLLVSTKQIEMYGHSSMPSTSSAKDVYRQQSLQKMKRKYAEFDSAKKKAYIDKVRNRNKLKNPQDKWFLRAQITMNESEGIYPTAQPHYVGSDDAYRVKKYVINSRSSESIVNIIFNLSRLGPLYSRQYPLDKKMKEHF